jgi:hypothetical protein
MENARTSALSICIYAVSCDKGHRFFTEKTYRFPKRSSSTSLYRMNFRVFRQIIKSPLIIIVLIVCVANWQLLSGQRSLQWDALNFWQPWRYFISECYKNGLVPLWDPYTQAGYPVHGDLQGPAYNPEAIATSLLLPASVYVLNYIYVAYLILGAYGFYKLSLFFSRQIVIPSGKQEQTYQHTGAIVAGVLYALCGYNIGNAYFYVNISAALMPWIYYYYLKIMTKGNWIDSCKFAVFLFLQLTAGNPSFLIVSAYFMAAITGLQFIHRSKAGERREVLLALKQFSVAFVLLILMGLPVLINAYHIIPETTRANGISLEWASEERFALRNLFSFFTPLVSFERDTVTNLSQPLFDSYVGLLTLFFAAVGFIKYRSRWIYIFTGMALVSFLLCLGSHTPVFGWFFHLPFFNVFRMPRLIFLYDILFILLLASLGIRCFLEGQVRLKWFLFFVVSLLCLSSISLWYFNFVYDDNGMNLVDYTSMRSWLTTESQAIKAITSFGITFCLILIALIAYWRKWKYILISVLLFDIVLNYNLGASVRVFGENKAALMQSYTEDAPKGFAPPENIKSNAIRSLSAQWQGRWMNTSIYFKQPSYWSDNNFELSNYMKLYNDNPIELDYFTKQPLAFFADSLVSHIDSTNLHLSKVLVVVDEGLLRQKQNLLLRKTNSDTIVCEKFEPQHVIYRVQNKQAVAFVLQQNFTKLWHVKLDGNFVKPDFCFYSFPMLLLSGGVHQIEYIYDVPCFDLALGISLVVFLILILFIFYQFRRGSSLIVTVLVIVGLCSFRFYTGKKGRNRETLKEAQLEILANKEMKDNCWYIVNTRDAYAKDIIGKFRSFNFIYPEDVATFLKQSRETTKDYVCCITYKGYYPSELEDMLLAGFGERVIRVPVENGFVCLYHRASRLPTYVYEKVLNFTDSLHKGTDVKKGHDFSPAISFRLEEAKAKKYDLIFVEAETECDLADFKGLAFAVSNNGVFKKYLLAKPVHRPGSKTQELGIYYYLPENTRSDDQISVYVWNDDVRNVLLKKLRVSVVRKE